MSSSPLHNDKHLNAIKRDRIVAVSALTLFTDMLLYGIVIPILPSLILKRTGNLSESLVGSLIGCYAIGLLIVTPIISVFSDRYKNRKIPLLLGPSLLFLATVLFQFGHTFLWLFLSRIGQGIGGGISWTLGFTILADMFPPNELGTPMGKVFSANTFGFLIGPPIGGFIYDYFGETWVFVLCGLTAMCNFIAGLMLVPSNPACFREDRHSEEEISSAEEENEEEQSLNSHDSDELETSPLLSGPGGESITFWHMMTEWDVLCTTLLVILTATVFTGFEPVLPIYLAAKFNATPSQIGLMWACMMIPNLFFSQWAGTWSDKYGRKNISTIGLVVFATFCPLVALAPSPIWCTAALSGIGIGQALAMTPTLPEMSDFVEMKTRRGGSLDLYAQMYALFVVGDALGMSIGPMTGGLLLEKAGFDVVAMVSSMTLFATSIMVGTTWILTTRRRRSLELCSTSENQ